MSTLGVSSRYTPVWCWAWAWLGILAIVAAVAFYPGLNIAYFADDFQYVGAAPSGQIFYFFTHRNPFHPFYRPVNSAVLIAIQRYFALSTWPQHTINTLVHVMMAWLVYLFMLRAGFSRLGAVLGSSFMLLSQANAMAVLENDTFSQLAGTFFGYLALWLLYRCFFESGTRQHGRPAYLFCMLALPAFALSLWSKETSISFALLVGAFFLVKNLRLRKWSAFAAKTTVELLPFVAVTLAYLAVRARLGLPRATLGTTERYQLWPGLNMFKNLVFDGVAATIPVSSVQVYVAFQSHRFFFLALVVLAALTFAALVISGICLSLQRRLLTLLAAGAVLALFPSFLLVHASELYVYNTMPLVAVLMGAGMGCLLSMRPATTFAGAGLSAALVALFASFIMANHQKAELMKQNGIRAAELLSQIKPYLSQVPHRGMLVLVNPPADRPSYSDFLVNGFDVFQSGENILNLTAGRQDFSTNIVDFTEAPAGDARRMVLTLKDNALVELKAPTRNPAPSGTVLKAVIARQ
jgi:hypothetical protein